MLHYDTN